MITSIEQLKELLRVLRLDFHPRTNGLSQYLVIFPNQDTTMKQMQAVQSLCMPLRPVLWSSDKHIYIPLN